MNKATYGLRKYWDQVNIRTPLSDSYFLELIVQYDEDNRTYHNTTHLRHMLANLSMLNSLSTENVLACFYHDYIYVPGNSDNEEKSTKIALVQLTKLGFDKPLIDAVITRIMATIKHSDAFNDEVNQFLDSDMSILAASPIKYAQYQEKVRAEFRTIPNFLYFRGRKSFLKAIVKQRNIFLSEKTRTLWEDQARQNIISELAML